MKKPKHPWQKALAERRGGGGGGGGGKPLKALSGEDIFLYVAFVQHFILGRMNVSDSIYQQKGAAVERVAAFLRQNHSLKQAPLYRGWIIEPEKVVQGRILVEHPIPLSFTHDRGVACFFADPRTMISDFIAARRPRARGYMMTLTGWNSSQVLWSYEWDGVIPTYSSLTSFGVKGIGVNELHAIDSNLKTQKELILKPLGAGAGAGAGKTTLEPIEDALCPSTDELNRRYG